ncbi:hypothetical protein CNEONATC25_02230 [Clostridium neonatale]|uniref:Uncharacterized protein n=1 Tax=Clostridium neonatale TaxID=137838 RepID=A0A650LU85_9CLOT|nr:hypothetical protein CNEONATC25_02230 [Clostridium neonatale]SUQ47775.1 hypothetical protein CNEONATNEC32_02200 [Clostridium neonatale]SUQ48329.1 hypothetical protein CNEONATNEC26_02189 [Clostridium neonatale]VCT84608.1 hypothetical protein CNEONATNEC25_02208 [Clostridium neonatale]
MHLKQRNAVTYAILAAVLYGTMARFSLLCKSSERTRCSQNKCILCYSTVCGSTYFSNSF